MSSAEDGVSSERNLTRKFIFDEADVRGEIVHLDSTYREIIDIHQYPPGVSRLMGEFLVASVLLSTTIKFEGRLVLQAQGRGEVPLMMAEARRGAALPGYRAA